MSDWLTGNHPVAFQTLYIMVVTGVTIPLSLVSEVSDKHPFRTVSWKQSGREVIRIYYIFNKLFIPVSEIMILLNISFGKKIFILNNNIRFLKVSFFKVCNYKTEEIYRLVLWQILKFKRFQLKVFKRDQTWKFPISKSSNIVVLFLITI